MKSNVLLIPLLLILSLAFIQCANRGRPTGGAVDSIPPLPLRMIPENYTTNFSDQEILIHFDEYIRLDKLQENLIISPPLENTPIITPHSVGKILKISFQEKLADNTTYTFNFGNSIIDNNEGNVLEQFTYVLSTGKAIDSLELQGKIKDSRLLKLKQKTGVNLYRIDDSWNDTILYSGKPDYISLSDEDGNFQFSNLRAGKYFLVAIQKERLGAQHQYNLETDKVGFYSEYISIPNDSMYFLDLYKAIPKYKLERPIQKSNQSFLFGYKGARETPKIKLKSKANSTKEFQFKEIDKDSIYFWYKPSMSLDSLGFELTHLDKTEDLFIRLKEADTISFKIEAQSLRNPTDSLVLRSQSPIVSYNIEKIKLIDKDSSLVDYTLIHNQQHNYIKIDFEKEYEQAYELSLLPGAITDWYDRENDSLSFRSTIASRARFGSLHLNLTGIDNYPVIVDLINEQSKLVRSYYLTKDETVNFLDLNRGNYYIRLSFDLNNNKKWDTGDIEKRLLPEPVYFFDTPIEIHENWSINESLRVEF